MVGQIIANNKQIYLVQKYDYECINYTQNTYFVGTTVLHWSWGLNKYNICCVKEKNLLVLLTHVRPTTSTIPDINIS